MSIETTIEEGHLIATLRAENQALEYESAALCAHRDSLSRELAEARAATEEWKRKARVANDEGYKAQQDLAAFRGKMAFLENDPWRWQGDGFDHLESLACPILISADDLRALLSESLAARLEEVLKAADELVARIPMIGWGNSLQSDTDDIVARYEEARAALKGGDDG